LVGQIKCKLKNRCKGVKDVLSLFPFNKFQKVVANVCVQMAMNDQLTQWLNIMELDATSHCCLELFATFFAPSWSDVNKPRWKNVWHGCSCHVTWDFHYNFCLQAIYEHM